MKRTAALVLSSGLVASIAHAQPCGAPWSQVTAGPTGRSDYSVAYDSDRGKVVLFGGYAGTYLADTWEWAAAGPGGGGSWSSINATGATGHSAALMAFDASRRRMVLYGGFTGASSSMSNQTFEYDGSSWTLMQPLAAPPVSNSLVMAFDPVRQRIVLVQLTGFTLTSGATWEYDGTTWVQAPDVTPGGASGATAMAFDVARGRMVLTGPAASNVYPPSIGTFERDPGGWTLKEQGTLSSSSVTYASAAFDPVRGRVIMIDSSPYPGPAALWSWDGARAAWEIVSTGGGVGLKTWRVAWDDAGAQMVLFGGLTFNNNTPSTATRLFRSDVRDGPTLTDLGARYVKFPQHDTPGVLHIAATGSGTLSYQWRRNRVAISDGGSYSGVTTPDLSIDPTALTLSGGYDVVVTDSCGSTASPVTTVLIDCWVNCDQSTFSPALNANDFQCFLNAYASGQSYANCDHSTAPPVLNANDFQCFMNQFAIGCP